MYVCTLTHGNLLKWNTQSLTFTSVRPYSFDRERIQTEWNPHQHGCCAIDLSSTLTHWQREGTRRGVFGMNTIIAFLAIYWFSQNDTEKKKERRRGKERKRESFSQRNKRRLAWLWASSQHLHIRNHWRRRKTMQTLPCAGQVFNFRRSGRGRREQKWEAENTDE